MTRRLGPFLGAWLLVAWFLATPAHGQSGGAPVIFGVNPPGITIGQTQEWSIAGRNLSSVNRMLISGLGVEVLEFSAQNEKSARARVRVAAGTLPGYREVRLDGPNGISNLAIVRIDTLRQVSEAEPADASIAQVVEEGSAVVGLLKPLDVDVYRVRGTPGRRLTLDLEARRIGTSISPVVTILSESGVSTAQAREIRGGDRDSRLSVVVPPDGTFLIQVRDNTYGGSDQARYRLRVDPNPFATAVFPLGGRIGETVEVEVSGGNLAEPRRKPLRLPEAAGSTVEVGLVDGPGEPILAPGRLVAGEGPEIVEAADRPGDSPIVLTPGVSVNGRIARAGEGRHLPAPGEGRRPGPRPDRGRGGSARGSIRWSRSATRREPPWPRTTTMPRPSGPTRRGRSMRHGVPEGSPDSSVEFEAKADGVLTIEVSDRFGDGGPEFGYRLAVGPARPGFSVTLLLGNANANALAITNLGQVATTRTSPGQFGVLNLKPGSSTPINFLVAPEGRPGPVEVSVEGLPDGVTAEPVSIRLPGPVSPGSSPGPPASAVADFLQLKVAPYATPGLAELRIVATARPSPGQVIVREATATIGLATAGVSPRPITRVISRVPLRVVGEVRPRFVGPPAPPTLRKVTVPGPLFLGDQLDLALEFDRSVRADDGSTLEATAEGVGMATNTIISAGTSINDEEASDVVIHVLASAKAKPGPHLVRVSYAPPGRPPTVREVSVEVRVPIEVRPKTESVFLAPGDSAQIPIEVKRQEGFAGEVEMKLEGLPRGVKLAGPVTVLAGKSEAEVRLEMSPTATLAKPTEFRVIGIARMSRGNVAVDSKIRPIIQARPADK